MVAILACSIVVSEFEFQVCYDIHFTYLALAGPSGISAVWGIEINGRFEAERPLALASAGPHSGGQAATLTPLFPLYSTGPCFPV